MKREFLQKEDFYKKRILKSNKKQQKYKQKTDKVMKKNLLVFSMFAGLLLFTDDYVALGGLVGLAASHVRVPQDLRVLTLSNVGFEPTFPVPLAQVRIDPRANGRAIAAFERTIRTLPLPKPDGTETPNGNNRQR